jgi:NAD(P)-dependent dehydrogenase (short-subunit alcohol dehydrogenase family)
MARRMADQGTPALIVNTGSENSLFHGIPNAAAYVASKAAVRALTRALSQDTPDHIDVKLLCPGYVNTPLGTSEQMQHGMDVEAFADIAFPLLTSDQFHLVTHGYNGVRVREEHDALQAEIAAGAASVEDTARYDVGLLMQAAQSGR